jgi:hypothetical protein
MKNPYQALQEVRLWLVFRTRREFILLIGLVYGYEHQHPGDISQKGRNCRAPVRYSLGFSIGIAPGRAIPPVGAETTPGDGRLY